MESSSLPPIPVVRAHPEIASSLDLGFCVGLGVWNFRIRSDMILILLFCLAPVCCESASSDLRQSMSGQTKHNHSMEMLVFIREPPGCCFALDRAV